MSIFRCDNCGCVENTACSYYSLRERDKTTFKYITPALCSKCDPKINKWHNKFPKQSAKGLMLASDGFLYHQEEDLEWRIKNQGLTIIKIIEED